MEKINVLDKLTAEKIAAGEVVERPASVIKELVENAIDAGATTITVEIRDGGTSYMRVSDNGSGMDRNDATTAFLRHATSKIRTEHDLEKISTLGFRGEALCSIAAVSHTELFTKRKMDEEGTHVVIEGGEQKNVSAAGCPDGTTIVVKNLFFNTPARMKFLKKDSQEAAAIVDVCNKQALSHPDVSVRLIRDGKEVLFSPGDSILEHTVHAVFGKEISSSMIKTDYTRNDIHIYGLTGKNNLSRPNRLMQVFFINGRFIVNKVLLTAISEAYKNELMTGRFPVCVLNIEINPALVDVNVHPGKTEVKFASDQNVYEAVYWAVKNALCQKASPREVFTGGKNKEAFHLPNVKNEKPQLSFENIKVMPKSQAFKPYSPLTQPKEERKILTQQEIREEVLPYNGKLPVRNIEGLEELKKEVPVNKNEPLFKSELSSEKAMVQKEEEPQKKAVLPPSDVRIIGQLFSTYILAEGDGEFFLMDQHAAHERIQYEKLRANGYKTDTQLLLMPISVNLTPQEKALALEKKDVLLNMGFELEEFGTRDIVLRSLPADCLYEDGKDLFIEVLGVFSGAESGAVTESLDKAIYTIACRSAIKANQTLTVPELEKLYNAAMALEGITTCPHGRPITIKLTKYQIEKMFGRII